jgi:predicted MFS family arabinose efflux permease
VRPAAHPIAQIRAAIRRPQLARLLVVFAAVVFSFSTMETTLSLLCATAYGMTATHIYWLFGYMGVMTTLMQGGIIGRLSQRIDESRLALVGAVLLAVGLAAAPFTAPLVPLLVSLGAVAFGQGIASPVLSSLISKAGGGQEHGEVLGLSQSVGSLSRILGPMWGGTLFDYAGPAGPYVTTALLMGLASIVALSLPQRVTAGATAAKMEADRLQV